MILDHATGIDISQSFIERHSNEVATLEMYFAGLELLNHHISSAERVVVGRVDPTAHVFSFGNHSLFDGISMPLVSCLFGWYAVTACNFTRLVGWLHHQYDPSQPDGAEYMRKVLPDVSTWRNKVGAHPARACDWHGDNEAERLLSVIPQVCLDGHRLVAGGLMMVVSSSGVKSDSAKIRPWSATEVHERLRARFGTKTKAAD